MHDLRVLATEIDRELEGLTQARGELDACIRRTRRQRALTPGRRFWRGFGLGLVAVGGVWVASAALARAALGAFGP